MPRCSSCYRRLPEGVPCPEHREAAVSFTDAGVGVRQPPPIPGYTLHRRLGAGGFAQVFSAARDRDGEPVALKVALNLGDWRFEREVEALRRVPSPHAPRLIEAGEAEGFPFIAMELVAGRSLADWLAAQPLAVPPRSEAVNVLRAISTAVEALHGIELIHRDIKPENLILHGSGVTLIDFGLARRPRRAGAPPVSGETLTGVRLGTPIYMAPEQCLGSEDLGFETDTYAVGIMAFELLCGRPPFVGSASEIGHAHITGRPPAASSLGDLPEAVDAVFSRALAKAREDRYASAGQLYVELAGALGGRGRRRRKIAVPEVVQARPRARRRRVVLMAIESRAPVQRLRDVASHEDGELIGTRRDCYLIAFPRAVSLQAGIRAAIKVAGRVETLGGRCVIHVALLRIKEGPRGVMALGRAVDRVEEWMPRENRPDASMLLTAEAAGELSDSTREAGLSGFFRWARDDGGEHSVSGHKYRGREALIEAILDGGQRCLSDRIPLVSTVIGPVGSGKSRLLAELETRLRAPDRQVLSLRASSLGAVEGREALERLLGFALGVNSLDDRAAVAAASQELLGRSDDGLIDSIASVATADDTETAPAFERRLIAWSLGEALRRRAESAPVVIVLDDAHLAEAVVLDGLEQATAEPGVALWVLAAAAAQLETLRPTWGERACASLRHELEPLEPEAAERMLLDLLQPAEFIPEPVVARLVELCEGVPLYLVEVAQLLRTEGRIRRLRGTESYYVDADDLLRISATPLAERLAGRMLESLPGPLVALARVAAILEHRITPEAVERVGSEMSELAELDAGVGLAQLARAGLVAARADSYRFRNPLLCEAVRATIPPAERRGLHAAVAAFLESQQELSPSDRARLAGHLVACGRREDAATIYVRLGDRALAALEGVEAESQFTAALGQLGPAPTPERQRALAGRGRARVRLRKLVEAAEDLEGARDIAESRGDTLAVVEYLLEEATLRDLSSEFVLSESLVQRACELSEDNRNPTIEARCANGLGRSHLRAERNEEAARDLMNAAELARRAGDYETQVAALLLLGFALALLDRLDESESVFGDVIRLCEGAGDVVHLGAAHGNRVLLWTARHDYGRAIEDLEASRRCARVAGHPTIERVAEHNLAELLLWMGRLEEALPSVLRSRDLEARYYETRTIEDTLLLARIRCARGEIDEARELLAWIDGNIPADEVPPTCKPLVDSVRLRCDGGDASSWVAAVDEAAEDSYLDAGLEIAFLGIEALAAAGDRDGARRLLERAEKLEPPAPWAKRFAALAEKVV